MNKVSASARGRLAEHMVPVAMAFVGVIRDQDAEGVTRFLRGLSEAERETLPVILAAMVPDDRTPHDLLAWVDFDEHGKKLPEDIQLVLFTPKRPRDPWDAPAPEGLPARLADYAELRDQNLSRQAIAERMGISVQATRDYDYRIQKREREAAA